MLQSTIVDYLWNMSSSPYGNVVEESYDFSCNVRDLINVINNYRFLSDVIEDYYNKL